MNVFEIALTEEEIIFLRHATDHIQVQGKDCKFVATVQVKLEQEIAEIKQLKLEAEQIKSDSLQQAIKQDLKTKA
jgi:hypothetical protein